MRVAVFLPNWIGDVVMATPAVKALRDRYPTGHFVGVLRPYVAGVVGGANWFDELLPFDPKGPAAQRTLGVAAALRSRRIDLAVLFPNSLRAALAAWLGGCTRRVGFARYGRGPLLTKRLYARRAADGGYRPSPILLDYNALAEAAGTPPPGTRLRLHTTAADEEACDAVWSKFGLGGYPEVVCLNPGAAFGAAKHWPTAHFAAVARDMIDRRGCGVLVLCGPGERDLARAIVAETARSAACSLADEPLSLGLTKACVRRADLLVTTDSGPRHFAAAFDRPVVTLFGPTWIDWTETWHPKATNLQKPVPCGPCQQRVCPLGHHRCMTELTPAEVLSAAENLLPGRLRHAG